MPPPAIIAAGLAIGAGGAIGQIISGNEQADAAQSIASAQQAAAQNQRAQALQVAMPTTQELQLMSQQLKLTDQANARQAQLLDAVDPALMEAGTQALKLLRGQTSSTLAPLQAERDRQRGQLVASLRAQMGEGAENSSAGAEALNRFDAQTAQVTSEAQQKMLSSLLGTAAGSRPNPYGAVQANAENLGLLGNFQARQIAAINGNSLVPYAGAPYAGQAVSAANQKNLFGGLTSLGGTITGAGIGGMKNTPTQPGMQPTGITTGLAGAGEEETSSLQNNLRFLQGGQAYT